MNYKKVFPNQELRFKILQFLNWVPDSVMLRIQYRIKTGRWPNLKHPQRFTEKLQVYKMKYRNPLMHQCVDKYEVRKYVESKGLGYILNDLYGICDKAEDVDLRKLPDQFVIKSTTGSGGINVILVKDKTIVCQDDIINAINSWQSNNKGQINAGREWAYSGLTSTRIILEKYLDDKQGLVDYKFFCFNGEPKYLYVVTDRRMGKSVALRVYDMDFNPLSVFRCDERKLESSIEKPKNFEQMIKVAKELSTDFPHVRVDLYNIEGRVYFGELTFYDGSGYFKYDPDEFDFKAGDHFTEYC